MANNDFPQPGQHFTWDLTPKGQQVAAQLKSGSQASTPSNFGLAQAPGEDNDAYARSYASDKAIY